MTEQALNYLLGQLQQLGYLTRETDEGDQRSKRIRLTPRGHAAIKAIRETVQDVETEWEQQLGPRKFAQLRDLLTQLYAIATPTKDRARRPAPANPRRCSGHPTPEVDRSGIRGSCSGSNLPGRPAMPVPRPKQDLTSIPSRSRSAPTAGPY